MPSPSRSTFTMCISAQSSLSHCTTLRPGILVIHSERDAQRIVVDGGFAEVGPAGLTVLANLAVPVDEFDVAALAGMIKDTEEDVADEKDGWNRDKLAQKLDRLKALQAAPLPLARRAVRNWLRCGSDLEQHPPDAATVERVLCVARGDAVATDVGGGRRVARSRGRLTILP